jgi:hypothetical protein
MKPTKELVELARRGSIETIERRMQTLSGQAHEKDALLYLLLQLAFDHGFEEAEDRQIDLQEYSTLRNADEGQLTFSTTLELARWYLTGAYGLAEPILAKPHLRALADTMNLNVIGFGARARAELNALRLTLSGKAAAVYDSVFAPPPPPAPPAPPGLARRRPAPKLRRAKSRPIRKRKVRKPSSQKRKAPGKPRRIRARNRR